MIKTVVIDSIDGVLKLISDSKYNDKIQRRRSSYFYRGLSNVAFNLTTSIRLNCKELYKELEPQILRNFTKYASIEDEGINSSVWKQMIIGQHHGLPTRLMDLTRSPLVALHFACTEANFDKLNKRDCVVWRFDMNDVNKNLPEKYYGLLEKTSAYVYSLDDLLKVVDSLSQYDRDMGNKAFVTLEPPSLDQRIINQYSFFAIIPNQMTDIEEFLDKYTEKTIKYIIKADIRWDVRDMLDQFNVNERITFPGLDGLSKTLARHYFVKSKETEDESSIRKLD